MKVAAKGFQAYAQNGVVVNVSSTLRVDIHLTVGAETQTVTVEADALAVQTDSNVVSTLVSEEQITEIATENRNFAALGRAWTRRQLQPARQQHADLGWLPAASISVNGLRQSHNIWLIDGGEADDRGGAGGIDILPSQDAIAQIETLSSNYPPDYGISSGATISLSLKSGTQNFHGEAWEFNRNTAFNANSYQQAATPIVPRQAELQHLRRATSAARFSFLRSTTRQDKTFFFWNEEWRKLIQGSAPNLQNDLPAADFPTAGQDLTYIVSHVSASGTTGFS